MNLRVGRHREEGEVGYYNERNTPLLNHPRMINNWVRRNYHEESWNRKRSGFGSSWMGNEEDNFRMPIGDFTGSLKPRPMLDRWVGETNEPVVFIGQGRGLERRERFPIGYAEQKRIHRDNDGPSRVRIFENERVELLRKLDELKDQIIRCGDLTEKPRERLIRTPPVLPNNYFGDDSSVRVSPTKLYTVSMQPFAPDKYFPEPLYFGPSKQPVRHTNQHGLDVQDLSYPRREISNEIVVYDSSNPPQRPSRHPHHPPPEYLMPPYHDPFSGQHMASNQRTIASQQHETFSTHIACSCLQCYNTNRKFPSHVPPTLCDSKDSNTTIDNFVIQSPKTVSSMEFDFGMGVFAHRDRTRVVAAHGSEKACLPVLGGAPFLACCSCFESIKLPRKLVVMGKNQQKVQCGACSAILLVDFEKKRVIVTFSHVPKQVLAKGDDAYGKKLSENLQSLKNHSIADAMDLWSNEFEKSGCKFPVTDTDVAKPNILSSDQNLNFSYTVEQKDPLSSASSFTEDQQSTDTMTFRRETSISSTVPQEDDVPSPLSDSLDQNKPNNDSSSHVVSRYEDQEKVILNRSTSEQKPVEDVSVATEFPSHGLLNSSVSQDSTMVTKEELHPKISEVVSNAITVYFPISSQSVEKERSNDFDNSDSKSPQTVTGVSEPNVLSNDKRQNFVKSIERKVLISSTSSFSEDENSPTIVIFQRNILFSSKVPPKDDGPLPSSDLDQKEPNYYFPSNVVSRYEDQQKVILNRTTLQHNTVENASVATGIEVPSSELLHSSVSQNSAVVGKEEDCPRIKKLVSNASTVYFSCSGRSMDTERLKDFDNYDYGSQLTDTEVTEANILSSHQRQNFTESIERTGPLSSSSRFSKDEHNSDNVSFQDDISLSSYVPRKDDVPSTLSASLKENGPKNYSDMASRYEDQQKVILNRSTPKQNNVKDISSETGNEVTPHKLRESRLSQDSTAVRKEEDRPMMNKLLSNASTDYFSYSIRSVETERANVFVNGQPISPSAVKNAENLAGPIETGNYWYDNQGGFWGVMGHPCLGIIPPFIEEFRYPMSEDCAAGNTGVFVNGRELNQKDLDLLAARGLPTTRDRYYVIEICGTVLDENTGEKLPSLGKLAPTVRKVKQGFGMRTPRALAR